MKLSNHSDKMSLTRLKSITLLAILVAITVAGRLVFAFIPNVQPVTTLIILFTLLMGVRFGLVHASLTMVVSNLILGFGIWTWGQVAGYMVIVLLTAFLIRPIFKQIPLAVMIIYASSTGFIYGFIQALFQAPLYGFDYFYAYYLSGLLFDGYHAIGNAMFYLVLAPTCLPLLDKLLIRYSKS